MTWQEELHRLDEELASGRLSVDDYRRRRDDLIAQLAAGQAGVGQGAAHQTRLERVRDDQDRAQPVQAEQTQAEQVRADEARANQTQSDHVRENQERANHARAEQARADQARLDQRGMSGRADTAGQPDSAPRSPFPPAFRWDSPERSEATDVIEHVDRDDPDSSEETQVVHTPGPPPSASGDDDSERTQVVQATPPPPPPYEQPPYQGSSGLFTPANPSDWTRQESAPPWASSDVPPIQEPNAGWMMQGPEFFETEKKDFGITRIVLVGVAVVVLAGIAFGTWFFWGRDTVADSGQQGGAEPVVTTTEPAPEDPLAPAGIGGNKEPKNVDYFRDLPTVGFLTPAELDALAAAGAGESRLLITNFDQGKATILVSETASPELATVARDTMTGLQLGYGFAPRPAPPGVNSVEVLNNPEVSPTLRALYASGNLIVRVEMRGNNRNGGSPNSDPAQTAAKFDEILGRQLEKLPANV